MGKRNEEGRMGNEVDNAGVKRVGKKEEEHCQEGEWKRRGGGAKGRKGREEKLRKIGEGG